MATATVSTKPMIGTQKGRAPNGVTLRLDEEETRTLYAIASNVLGGPNSIAKYARTIRDALAGARVPVAVASIEQPMQAAENSAKRLRRDIELDATYGKEEYK